MLTRRIVIPAYSGHRVIVWRRVDPQEVEGVDEQQGTEQGAGELEESFHGITNYEL